jgi:hypothetical protein
MKKSQPSRNVVVSWGYKHYFKEKACISHIPQFGETLFRIVGNAGIGAYITYFACFNGIAETSNTNICSKYSHFCDLSFL